MGRKLNFDELDDLFEQGEDFRLTDKEYEKRVGSPLPKEKSYIKNRSPFGEKARKCGYMIADIEEKAVVERTIILKKIRREN